MGLSETKFPLLMRPSGTSLIKTRNENSEKWWVFWLVDQLQSSQMTGGSTRWKNHLISSRNIGLISADLGPRTELNGERKEEKKIATNF